MTSLETVPENAPAMSSSEGGLGLDLAGMSGGEDDTLLIESNAEKLREDQTVKCKTKEPSLQRNRSLTKSSV